MLKLESTFHLSASPNEVCRRDPLGQRLRKTKEITLSGLSISIETKGKTYQVCSDEYAASDHPAFCRGTIWPRSIFSLGSGISVEQQMLLPAGGGALAACWRLIGRSSFPLLLKVTPIFQAHESHAAAGCGFQPEMNGGRLAWRPYDNSSKIIADTNGSFAPRMAARALNAGIDFPERLGIAPGTFEFLLRPRPSLLILAAEAQAVAALDPLIGAFLAHVAEQRAASTIGSSLRNLVAA